MWLFYDFYLYIGMYLFYCFTLLHFSYIYIYIHTHTHTHTHIHTHIPKLKVCGNLVLLRGRLAFLSNKVFLNECIYVVCLDTMQLYSSQTTEQCNYNFYMQWETKNFVWLILFQWSGTEPALSLKYTYRHHCNSYQFYKLCPAILG